MEGQQVLFLILGFSIFVSVIYWSAPYHTRDVLIKAKTAKVKKPNFVFILTDDQDVVLDGMLPMTNVKKLIGEQGVTIANSFVASPLCCPSRSSILTGQYVHNHGAINNSLSGHCSSRQWQAGPERRSFPVHLHRSGYRTFFAGKYLNQYGTDPSTGGLSHVPPGWDWWIGLKGNSVYYNYTLSVNGTTEKHGSDPGTDYLTNVIRSRAVEFLMNTSFDKPFFMMLSTPSAHHPFIPELKYSANYSTLKAPRTDNFNIPAGKDKHWLMQLGIQPLPDNILSKVDEIFRNRLRTLLTVDDMVHDIIAYLDERKQLENTYFIFTSDNGYHLGQFSMPFDKREPYETDIRVPLLMKGPNIPAGAVITFPVTNIDLAPTFLDLAGIPIPHYMDGSSLKSIITGEDNISSEETYTTKSSDEFILESVQTWRSFLIEHSGESKDFNIGCPSLGPGVYSCDPDFSCKCEDAKNNTYGCVKHMSETEDRIFCVWQDSLYFEEMYDLKQDPYQLNNTAHLLTEREHQKLSGLLQAGPERKSFATHLHLNGYRTFFAGKYLNQYGNANVGGLSHVPPGWDWWIGLKGNSVYYNYTLSVNGTAETHGDIPSTDYLTNVIRSRAMEFLTSSSFDTPFFMMLSTPSAHAPFTPEPKYLSNFSLLNAPRTENFNIVAGKDKHWLMRLGIQPLPSSIIEKVDEVFRNRLRTLLTVNDMVEEVIKYLESKNQLDNTYVVFTSDNGYHLGQFSLPLDKREPYETDIRVPLLIRGPNIPLGTEIKFPVTNIDLAPTFLDLAGIPIPPYMDGLSVKSLITGNSKRIKDVTSEDNSIIGLTSATNYIRRSILVEHSGEGVQKNSGCEYLGPDLSGCNPDFVCKCEDSRNNTYACIRQISDTENQVFCKWNDRESFEEMYDLNQDPFQLNNTVRLISREVHRKFTSLLKNLQRCRGTRCQELGSFVI